MSHDPLAGLLRSFYLTTMASIYADTLQQAEQHHWGYRKFLQHLCESEAEDRRQRRIARLLKQSGLPDGKSLGNLEEGLLPEKIRRQLPTLLEGGFVECGENVLAFGLPGRGKSHFVAALGRELILRHGHPVLFIPTFKLVQKLLLAKKALKLEALLQKLDRYAVVCLDDIGYVQQDREEMEVLFTFLADTAESHPLASFVLRSSAVAADGALPAEFTGDGDSSTLPLEWSGAPADTKSYALIMHHIAPDGIKWYWTLYNLPATVHSLPKNVQGIGTLGGNSVNNRIGYAPPHSKGPGPKTYILTVYALSVPPQLDVPSSRVNRDQLLAAMRGQILATAESRVTYSRPEGAVSQTGERNRDEPAPGSRPPRNSEK